METIMTLVLEESEDISLDLLSTLLARVKKDDEVVVLQFHFHIFQLIAILILNICFCLNFIIGLTLIIIVIQEAFPIAKKLGERVLESCATKLKPYLGQAVKSLGIPMGDYSLVLSSICQDTSDALEKNYTCVTSEHTVSFLLVIC